MKPVIIGETFGWFSAGRNRRGIVLCGTLGYEQHLAHRWWRDLSDGIAGTGCAVVRFDYPGEGDSKASETQLGTALDAIRQVVRFLRNEVGVEEIVLVGLRLGGTLAALVAAEGGVDRLVLLAPFPRGRAYLREMELQGRLIDILPDGGPLPKRPGTLSVGGFTLSSVLRQDLSKIDLRVLDRPPASVSCSSGLTRQASRRGLQTKARMSRPEISPNSPLSCRTSPRAGCSGRRAHRSSDLRPEGLARHLHECCSLR